MRMIEFVLLLVFSTYWCAPQFPINACDESGCHISDLSLDSALSTFLCFTEEEYGAMGELEKKVKLAEKIVPRLLSEDGRNVQVDELLDMDSDRLVEHVNLVLHTGNVGAHAAGRKTKEQYLSDVIDGLVQKGNYSYHFYEQANPHVLALLNCEMQNNQDPERDGRGAFLISLLNNLGIGATSTTATTSTTAKPSSKWSYDGETGPEHWAELFPEHCAGESQSPINIVSASAIQKEMVPISFVGYDSITVSNTEVTNNGHALVLVETVQSEATLSGGSFTYTYDFLQLHFHWPSEHTIDGKQFDLEMHMVHQWSEEGLNGKEPTEVFGGLGVKGFFFEISEDDNGEMEHDNDEMEPLLKAIPSVIEPGTTTELSETLSIINLINPAITDAEGGVYSYPGSLTTPTCDEVVQWSIFKTPLKISKKQMDQFKTLKDSHDEPLNNNFRPVQDLNGREICYVPII